MLVVPSKKKLVLNTPRHEAVRAVIPHAKYIHHNGETLLAMDHGVDESLVLKNLGFKSTPAPILHYYDWPGRFKPMQHQRDTAAFLSMHKRALCLNAPGCGKTISALWAADYLLSEGAVKRVLIVCPLSTTKTVWAKEIYHHLAHRSFEVLTGSREARIAKMKTPGLQYAIINHDGFTGMRNGLAGKFDLVIYDECFVAGTPVRTPQGDVPIEALREGDKVLTSSGAQRISTLKRRTSTALVTLELSNGQEITCTPEHPIFTDAGWVTAANTAGRRLISPDDLSNMRGRVPLPEVEVGPLGAPGEIAWDELLHILQVEENQRAESQNGDVDAYPGSASKVLGDIYSGWTYTVSGGAGTNLGDAQGQGAQAESAWGEWHGNDAERGADRGIADSGDGLELYRSVGAEAARLSYQLQGRLRNSGAENSYRGRWEFTQPNRAEGTGQKEGSALGGTWVARVTHQECGSPVPVYNLKVAGTPNYYAGGHLVHNCTAIKSPTSQRYKHFFKWVELHHPWLWMLTGTPISQNPTDAWTLARLMDCPILPRSYLAFKDIVMQKVTQYKWVPRVDALETCRKVLVPSIRYSLDECMELPETVFIDHECDMSLQQHKAFKHMQEECVVSFSSGIVTAANAAVMMSKLMQIACGCVLDSDGSTIHVDAAPRLETFMELVGEIGDKMIVFVPFKGVQYWLLDELRKKGYDAELVNGDVSVNERTQIFNDFQNTAKVQILVAHPRVAAHGLTLTRSSDVVWFAPIYSLEQYEQANARIRRLTTTGKTRVHHLYSSPFEQELYKRLKNRQRVLSDFLKLVKGENHGL